MKVLEDLILDFLTTHVLSKNVEIKSDIYVVEDQLKGFSLTMYREGEG